MSRTSPSVNNDVSEATFIRLTKNILTHAVFAVDKNGKITSWNKGAVKMTGWKESETLNKSLNLIYPDVANKANVSEANLELAAAKGTFQAEIVQVGKSGDTFLSDVSITAIKNGSTVEGYVVIAQDTTQRKRDQVKQLDANTLLRKEIDRRKSIEKALKESNDELNAFASAAGHDLQEPLRMVVSYLQLIERRYADRFDQDGLDFLAFAIDGSTRMKQLIIDLVEYSRIETLGKPFKKTDANSVLEDVLDSMEVSIEESHAHITHDKLPTIWSDEVQLNELFQNLIANAIKFGVKGGRKPLKIHVGVERRANEDIFSVQDNGPGIDKKNFALIFLIFKQVGNKLQLEGNGIGLAISKKIIKRHHGQIWVESELGQGSTFKFSIPHQKEIHE